MTNPSQDDAFAPARRNRSRFTTLSPGAPSSVDVNDAEVARGQSDAVLGGLARMQLKLDLLTREHSDALARIEALLAQLDHRLDQQGPPQR